MLTHRSHLLGSQSFQSFCPLLRLDLTQLEVLRNLVHFFGFSVEPTVVVSRVRLLKIGGISLQVVVLRVHELLVPEVLGVWVFQIEVS